MSFGGTIGPRRHPDGEAGQEAADASDTATGMVDQVGDGISFESDPARYRKLALAALGPLVRPTEAMVDAAHKAV